MATIEVGRLITVLWKERDIPMKEETLRNFIKLKTKDTNVVIKLNAKKNTALIQLTKAKGIDFLKASWKDDKFWTITELHGVAETCALLVSNLPPSTYDEVYLYFTNKLNVKMRLDDIELDRKHFKPEEGHCIINLTSAEDVKKMCENQKEMKKFKTKQLLLSPHYSDISEQKEIPNPDPVTIDVDPVKFKYITDFCQERIKEEYEKQHCTKLRFSKDHIQECKVQLEFVCSHDHIKAKKGTWTNDIKKQFEHTLESIRVAERKLDKDKWQDVGTIEAPHGVWIKEDAEKLILHVVGQTNIHDVDKVLRDIDAIKPPSPVIAETVEFKDRNKLMALNKLHIHTAISQELHVHIEIDCRAGKVTISGTELGVKQAHKQVLQKMNDLNINRYDFPNADYANLLNTPLMKDTIKAKVNKTSFEWNIDMNGLVLFSIGQLESEELKNEIFALVTEKDILFEGKVDSKKSIEHQLKKTEADYSPYVKLSYTDSKDVFTVKVVCGSDYFETVQEDLLSSVWPLLIVKETIAMSTYIFDYMQDKSKQSVIQAIKSNGVDPKCVNFDEKTHTITVEGNVETRTKVMSAVRNKASKILASWRPVEEDGIDLYMFEEDGYGFVKSKQKDHSCIIKIASKNEMKNTNVHCIVLLETGQAIFACTGDLTKPNLPVDVIVNSANNKLEHTRGLAKQICKIGGKDVQKDCDEHIKRQGPLEDGSIYVGKSGKLPCQRIMHTVSQTNNEETMTKAVKNVLNAMNENSDFILRSVAMPLLGWINDSRAAEIILTTIQQSYKKLPNVREIYLYDSTPNRVRTIQQQMENIFKDRCYQLPVKNIGLGKGTMTLFDPSKHSRLERAGSRTLPLPGGKKIMIAWGELSKTKTEVVVNVTKDAPKPSGVINKSLTVAAGVGCNLTDLCEKEFMKVVNNGVVPNGTIVQTMSGRIPCNTVYHIKIADKWGGDTNGNANLTGYIKTCLKEAIRQKRKSIAFPTIGTTSDCDYPGDKVALTFIRTIGDFMKLHASSELEDIIIVIYKNDISMTAAFEHTIETIYSQRPHRLQAAIEESVQDREQDDDDGKNTKDVSDGKPKTSSNSTHINEEWYTINGQADLALQKGNLQDSTADVIVCPTSTFPKLHGAVPDAIMRSGGKAIQNNCNNQYPKGNPKSGIPSTGPGNLNCKKVYYITLKDYTNASDSKVIYDSVLKCLEQAEKDKMTSIAFPSIGTGGFKFPEKLSADESFKAIRDFFSSSRTYVTQVVLVLYHTPPSTVQTFNTEVKTFFNQKPSKHQPQATVASPSMKYSWKFPNTATRLDILFGNLETSKADVIVDTTTSFPNLNGAIPQSLSKIAGPELAKECKKYQGNAVECDIVVTKGFNLQCQKVFHFILPTWNNSTGETMIQNCVEDCLHKLKQHGLVSIAFPSIGTGGAKYDARLVAEGMFKAVDKFATANPAVQCEVKIVLFPAATGVNKIFTDAFEKVSTNKGQAQKSGAGKGVRFDDKAYDRAGGSYDNRTISTQNRDFVLLQFTSDDPANVDLAYKAIKKRIADETKTVDITLKKDNNDDDLDIVKPSTVQTEIGKIAEAYHIHVNVDIGKRKISIKGIGDRVMKCYERILNYIQDLRKQEQQRKVGQIVFRYLEWCYTEDGGIVEVPYPKHIAFLLEDAFSQGVQLKEFKDTDEVYYVVDFNKMSEYVKEDSTNPNKTVCVIRRDLAAGELEKVPDSWEPMGDLENVKEVVLKASDQEYKDVDTEFSRTLHPFALTQIKEIRRIQNQTLYQQYHTKRKQLEAECKNHGVKDIERKLWHGIKADSERLITSNGFNRSYSGVTFGGHVWYGHGVYCAVNSGYSADDSYSAPDITGSKRVYQVKVLTGNTVAVAKGYAERYAPLLPLSKTDRFNSVCDDMKTPTEFVIFSDTQAYPEYIILFK